MRLHASIKRGHIIIRRALLYYGLISIHEGFLLKQKRW